MRRSLIPLSAVLASVLATGALAASLTDTAQIKALDPAKHQITLQDGKTFQVPSKWQFASYKVGQKVKVTYQTKNGQMVASDIRPAA